LVDADIKPWLLEVNVGPSFNQDAEIDKIVKLPLITDVVNMIGIKPFKRRRRIMGVSDTAKMGLDFPRRRLHHSFFYKTDVTAKEFISYLGADDILVLIEAQEEAARRGNFRRVWPTVERIRDYKCVFDCPRINNLLYWEYIKLKDGKGINVLDMLFKSIDENGEAVPDPKNVRDSRGEAAGRLRKL
jgi:hypothetical protein